MTHLATMGSVKTGALMDKASLSAARPYIVSAKPWPSEAEIARKAGIVMRKVFALAVPGREQPRAVVTIGVMGSGKSTAVKKIARGWRPAVIDPDQVCIALLGHGRLPSGGDLYDLSHRWTTSVVERAVAGRYNVVYDAAVPSERLLKTLRRAGYRIEMLLVRATREKARGREVSRDLRRGWGRAGVSERAHISTAADISKNGPRLAAKYADSLTVCDNTGRVMRCLNAGQPRALSATALAHYFRP